MRIAMAGTQGTGKTTLLKELLNMEEFKDYTFKYNTTRELLKEGFKINKEGDILTQLMIISEHVLSFKNKNFISDRSLLDAAVYTEHQCRSGKIDQWVVDYAFKVLEEFLPLYDAIFYLEPEFNLVSDGERSDSIEYRDEIKKIFDFCIVTYNIPIVKLTGSLQQRKEIFLKTIEKFTII